MTHIIIAPSYRRFRQWCEDTHTNPYQGRWISKPEDLRGWKYHQLVFLGWPQNWNLVQINDATEYIAHMQVIENHEREQPVYEKPTIYGATQAVTGDQMKAAGTDLLARLHNVALEQVTAKANANGDYLDPNSIVVRVTVEARAL